MEGFQDTFTVRTREGHEFSGLTLSSLQISVDQKIFSLEDSVRSEKIAGAWSPLGQFLRIQAPSPIRPHSQNGGHPEPESRASTGIGLDLGAYPSSAHPSIPAQSNRDFCPQPSLAAFSREGDEGPALHRLRIAGAFLLLWGILGMVGYAFGRDSPTQSIPMLVNTGLGVALLMNYQAIRRWAMGWVVAGWALACLSGMLVGGCFGLVLVALFSGLVYGGPACLLWGEECPRGRFLAGVSLMGALLLLVVLALILVAWAGATLLQHLRF